VSPNTTREAGSRTAATSPEARPLRRGRLSLDHSRRSVGGLRCVKRGDFPLIIRDGRALPLRLPVRLADLRDNARGSHPARRQHGLGVSRPGGWVPGRPLGSVPGGCAPRLGLLGLATGEVGDGAATYRSVKQTLSRREQATIELEGWTPRASTRGAHPTTGCRQVRRVRPCPPRSTTIR
jgi:hypothetical protein